MHCFNHPTNAVGLCKHCQRALCKDCCTDLGHGLACKNQHEVEVNHYNALIENAKRTYESSPKSSLMAPIFSVLAGMVFMYFGAKDGVSNFSFILGIIFLLFGIISLIYLQKFYKKVTTKY